MHYIAVCSAIFLIDDVLLHHEDIW